MAPFAWLGKNCTSHRLLLLFLLTDVACESETVKQCHFANALAVDFFFIKKERKIIMPNYRTNKFPHKKKFYFGLKIADKILLGI